MFAWSPGAALEDLSFLSTFLVLSHTRPHGADGQRGKPSEEARDARIISLFLLRAVDDSGNSELGSTSTSVLHQPLRCERVFFALHVHPLYLFTSTKLSRTYQLRKGTQRASRRVNKTDVNSRFVSSMRRGKSYWKSELWNSFTKILLRGENLLPGGLLSLSESESGSEPRSATTDDRIR